MAGPSGIEPETTVLETDVIPLHHEPMQLILTDKWQIVINYFNVCEITLIFVFLCVG